VFRTAAFRDVIFKRTSKQEPFSWPTIESSFSSSLSVSDGSELIATLFSEGKLAVLFEVEQVRVTSEHQVHISGSGPTFGEWQPKRSLRLSDNGFPKWTIAVNITRSDLPLRYKYVTVKDETYHYEHGQDRGFTPAPLDDRDLVIVRDKPFFVSISLSPQNQHVNHSTGRSRSGNFENRWSGCSCVLLAFQNQFWSRRVLRHQASRRLG